MDYTKLKSHLELTTNVAVVLVAVVVLSVFAQRFFHQNTIAQLESGLKKGKQLNALPASLGGIGANQALIVAMSTTCHYCRDSVPFYNRLEEMRQEIKGSTHIVAIFPDPEAEVTNYTQKEKLKVKAIAAIDFDSVNVTGTPTIILVDASGKILDFWVGKLSNDQEKEVIKAVGLDKSLDQVQTLPSKAN